MNFDFMNAKLKHSMWRLRLRDFLDGKSSLTLAQAVSHRDCDLGQWLYQEGLVKYASIPEMKQMETEHEALHRTVRTVIELKAAGKSAEAEIEFSKINQISTKVIALLTTIEAKAPKQT